MMTAFAARRALKRSAAWTIGLSLALAATGQPAAAQAAAEMKTQAIMENGSPFMQMAIIHVLPGKEAEFEAIFARRRPMVLAEEPDALVYDMYRSMSEPRTYIVHEYFTSQAAEEAHLKHSVGHPEYETPQLIACFDGKPVVHVMRALSVAR